jgi:hypothetical protein
MTTDEEDYSDYIKHMSNLSSVGSLLAGFTFTTLTLLITRLPDPSSIMSQLVLFFIAVLFYLFIFLVGWNANTIIYFCRNVPPKTKQLSLFNLLTLVSYVLLGVTVILMFLLWNLIYLALASGIVWALFIISFYIFVWKPFITNPFPEARAKFLGKVEKKETYRD